MIWITPMPLSNTFIHIIQVLRGEYLKKYIPTYYIKVIADINYLQSFVFIIHKSKHRISVWEESEL